MSLTVKELAAGIILFSGAVTAVGTGAVKLDARYMNAAAAAKIDAHIYHLSGEIANNTRILTLYDARLEVLRETNPLAQLAPADASTRAVLVSKINEAIEETRRLQSQRAALK